MSFIWHPLLFTYICHEILNLKINLYNTWIP